MYSQAEWVWWGDLESPLGKQIWEGVRWVKQILSQIFVPFFLFCHPNQENHLRETWCLTFLSFWRLCRENLFAWWFLLAGCINCAWCTKLDNILSRFQNLCYFICCFVIFDFVAISFNTALWYFEGIKTGHSGKCVFYTLN